MPGRPVAAHFEFSFRRLWTEAAPGWARFEDSQVSRHRPGPRFGCTWACMGQRRRVLSPVSRLGGQSSGRPQPRRRPPLSHDAGCCLVGLVWSCLPVVARKCWRSPSADSSTCGRQNKDAVSVQTPKVCWLHVPRRLSPTVVAIARSRERHELPWCKSVAWQTYRRLRGDRWSVSCPPPPHTIDSRMRCMCLGSRPHRPEYCT